MIRRTKIHERLSVSNFSVRRGVSYDLVRALGRQWYYPCLIVIIGYEPLPTFIACILYLCALIHFRDKARRGKAVVVCIHDEWKCEV